MSKIVDLQEWQNQNEKVEKQESKLFLTEKQVRSFPKYKYASDEEVKNVINTLHNLALISYHAFCKEERTTLSKAA